MFHVSEVSDWHTGEAFEQELIPDAIKELCDQYDEAHDGWKGVRADIIKAYRLGQKDGPDKPFMVIL
jgi:hypothetical protein